MVLGGPRTQRGVEAFPHLGNILPRLGAIFGQP